MIRIGVVNIDTSHPKGFSEYLKRDSRARYAAIYNDGFRGDDEVEGFIRNCNLEKRCSSIEELAEIVDIGFVQGCNWNKHLEYAKPFINRRKPVFIDKPIVGSLADCRKLEELAANGAIILGSSSVRYASEIVGFLSKSDDERGQIVNVFGTAGVDDFSYGVHIVEAIGGIVGTGAVSNRYIGRNEVDGKVCETFFVSFANGIKVIYNLLQGTWQPFDLEIMTTRTTFQLRIDTTKVYGALLDRICDYMESGRLSLASVDALTESIKIMLAGRISREQNGEEIKLSDIPEDDPGYDGYKYEKEYAAAASNIYL